MGQVAAANKTVTTVSPLLQAFSHSVPRPERAASPPVATVQYSTVQYSIHPCARDSCTDMHMQTPVRACLCETHVRVAYPRARDSCTDTHMQTTGRACLCENHVRVAYPRYYSILYI